MNYPVTTDATASSLMICNTGVIRDSAEDGEWVTKSVGDKHQQVTTHLCLLRTVIALNSLMLLF